MSGASPWWARAAANAYAKLWDRALADLNEAVRLNPRHYWSWVQRGICHHEQGEYALAAGDFGVCIGLWPEFAWGYFNRGCAFCKIGKKTEAIEDYTAALERDPRFLLAYWNRGLALKVPHHAMNATSVLPSGLKYRDTPYAPRVRQVYGDSAALDWSALGVPFDMVFIDGCHSYDYVMSDTLRALGSVRQGGLVIWHDYGMIEDVSRVVDETASRIQVRAIRSTSLAVGFVS